MRKKNHNGITIVSLVVTIVIILILAGITISFVSGTNGVITKAEEARNKTQIETVKESIQIDLLGKMNNNGTIAKGELVTILEKYGEVQYNEAQEIETIKINDEFSILISDIVDLEIIDEENKEFEKSILLDVARRYYTVDEIKEYIDIVATSKKACFQMHFSDDQNVGIECNYLDQTKSNAIVSESVYTNPLTGKNFLTFEQVKEIMEYCKSKNVTFIPEIDVPAHMTGFFDLARIKFGDDFVNNIARGTGKEAGNIDIVQPEADEFIISIYDEYTEFFKDCKYFHIGFDEYTYRIDEKIDYINKLYKYLNEKGFIVCMWNDSITTENIDKINNNIRIHYWQYNGSGYATVPDFQNKGFKVLITNAYYLFFVPSISNTNESDLNYTVNDIKNNWTLDTWDLQNTHKLENYDNILGGLICIWGENSEGVENDVILNQVKRMYEAMSEKLVY